MTHPNNMAAWSEIKCQRDHEHHTRRVHIDLSQQHGYHDYPQVPKDLAVSFDMDIWDPALHPVDGGPLYCPAHDAVSETIVSHCQPTGTMVRVLKPFPKGQGSPGGPMNPYDVPIEEVSVGDRVLSWNVRSTSSSFRRRGKPITDIAVRPYEGRLVVAAAGGKVSRYTPDHHVLVRLGVRRNTHVVYMMRRGDRYRIGSTYWTRPSEQFGPRQRAAHEGADAFWILSVHDSLPEARLHEALTSVQFGIPGVCFARPGKRVREYAFALEDFWSKLGANRAAAEACLRHFGRLIDFPLMTKAEIVETNEHYTKWTNGKTIKGAIATAAANLIDGMSVCVDDDRTYAGVWEPVIVCEEWYSGPVFSLEVAEDHTYVADGIVTHNCIWEPCETALVLAACEPGSHVLDFGAQIGWFSLLALSRGAFVSAIDAERANLELLWSSFEANAEQFAVMQADLATCVHRVGVDLADRHEGPVRLVKIDVEGAEDAAFREIRHLVEDRSIDYMLVEVSPVFADYYGELVTDLMRCGYVPHLLPSKQQPPFGFASPLEDVKRLRAFGGLSPKAVADEVNSWHQANLWFAREDLA